MGFPSKPNKDKKKKKEKKNTRRNDIRQVIRSSWSKPAKLQRLTTNCMLRLTACIWGNRLLDLDLKQMTHYFDTDKSSIDHLCTRQLSRRTEVERVRGESGVKVFFCLSKMSEYEITLFGRYGDEICCGYNDISFFISSISFR